MSIVPFIAQSPEQMPVGASWVVIGDWAEAAESVCGQAVIITPKGQYRPSQIREYATLFSKPRSQRAKWKRFIPETLITLAKDIRSLLRSRDHGFLLNSRLENPGSVPFVWQHHSMFQNRGRVLADRLGAPLVIAVEALQVREARAWGVRRPGWGKLLEYWAESRQLRRADLVTCISDELIPELIDCGLVREKILVTPNKASIPRFQNLNRREFRNKLGLTDQHFLIGWVGSFRAFHALDILMESFEKLQHSFPSARLLLAGDGPERPRLEALAKARMPGRVIFTGAVPYHDVPTVISAMDVGVIPARSGQSFHYSPLKLEEYMAAGIASVAPRAGQIPRQLTDGENALLYEPGNTDELSELLARLIDDSALRTKLMANGQALVVDAGGTDAQLRQLLDRLNTGS